MVNPSIHYFGILLYHLKTTFVLFMQIIFIINGQEN